MITWKSKVAGLMAVVSFPGLCMPFILQCVEPDKESYPVKPVAETISITGKGDDPLWKNAVELSDFIYPWEDADPSFTSFKALHNNEWLYCLFNIEDDEVLIYTDRNEETDALNSDRAEIFFKTRATTLPYYCLEIDPVPRVFDSKGQFQKQIDREWDWPKDQLIVRSARSENGYSIEIAISKQSLATLDLIRGNRIEAGLYRAECVHLDGRKATFRWVSWIKPDSETPDFHIPSSFGTLILE